ncbi:hypothetical protein C7B82_14985 [Stenomitos frigidus ULC18]|uniref:Uncharacterized protein n=2 Tax=Stenomitos TaxID=1844270 RepID=A0A2T1E625_9CYAN|nr:hypothetical protein C7B82_14985 [Stenomitos frigidus ULC18]
MLAIEQLTLNGAMTLLTYLQHSRLEDETTGVIAITAMLCEMLNQVESLHPGITSEYGWQPTGSEDSVVVSNSTNDLFLADDCYSDFKSASVS